MESSTMSAVRNCARQSFWKTNLGAFNPRQFQKMQGTHPRTDVTIIGGGIAGITCAARLFEQGSSVTVIEADRIGSGVTGNSTAKLSSLQRLKLQEIESKHGFETVRKYVEMNEAGRNQLRDWIDKFELPQDAVQWGDCANYTYIAGPDDTDNGDVETANKKIQYESQLAERAGLKASFITSDCPDLPFKIDSAVRVEDQSYFNSYGYVAALAEALRERGGDRVKIYEQSRVTDVTFKSPFTIMTGDGASIESDLVIVATHLPILDRSGHFGLVKPSQSYCIAVTLTDKSKMPTGMFITAAHQGAGNRSFRSADNGNVLVIGGCGHSVGDTSKIHMKNQEQCYEELERFAREHFPVENVICRWSAHDYMPADQIPYIGLMHHGTSSLYTVTGMQKWGLAMCSGAAIIISDLISGKSHERVPWAKTFDARRWDLTHSTLNALSYQAHVTKHFVGDRISDMHGLQDIESLGLDCGGICKDSKGHPCAAYRDSDGTLYQMSPNCTHLGCHVRWNGADRTFDCPCHGSRFNFDGSVIHGPATRSLTSRRPKM